MLMGLFNFMIIFKVIRSSRFTISSNKSRSPDEIKRARKKREMIKMIIIITVSYVIVELPCFIFNGYFYSTVMDNMDVADAFDAMFNNIQFSYSAFNIFILYASNKLFAKELKRLFRVLPRKKSINTQSLKPTQSKHTTTNNFVNK